ncbi:MAG: peptidoglycan DD-metalloendopeptidase family protein [Ruminococcus sp.]|nr:peptidoglycan DD-metalloendopeptidase family protein [Ruminococcus sp.]
MNRIFTFKRTLAFAAAIVICMTAFASAGSGVVSTEIAAAESTEMKKNKSEISDTQSKLDELEKKQAELDEKIAQTKDDISAEEENQAAIEEQINTVQETIMTLENSISDLNAEITGLEDSIAQKEIQIAEKKQEIEDGVQDFKSRIRTMYVAGSSSYSDILIGATDFYDMLMKIELVKRVAEHDDNMIDNLIDLKKRYEADEADLNAEKESLEKTKADLQEQEDAHQKQKDKLEELFAQSEAYLEQLAIDQKNFEDNKETILKEEEEFEKLLEDLYIEQAQIEAKEEAERKRLAEEAERKRQEELIKQQQQQQQNNISSSGTSGSSNAGGTTTGSQGSTDNSSYGYVDKSMFTWPVPGFYHISYGVGWRWGAYHKGIDIWSQGIRGANICASAAGTVILVSNTCTHDYGKNYSCGCGGGYGNYCIIDHGNGYWTLYGHSQRITVTQGQHVEKGDVLGQIGSTGHSTGDHLHFEVRLNGVAQNPSNYV